MTATINGRAHADACATLRLAFEAQRTRSPRDAGLLRLDDDGQTLTRSLLEACITVTGNLKAVLETQSMAGAC